jgi:peptidoglycan/LPS O-acetylase OafA/YrhL
MPTSPSPRPAELVADRRDDAADHADPHARYLATRVFGSLDGLRALAILAVVWHHANGWHRVLLQAPSAKASGLPISERGFLGVDLFFVISGFLIVTLLLRERRRTGGISLRGFYWRRFLRIFPPYYLMLAVFAAVAWLKPGDTSDVIRRELPFAFFYVSNLVTMHGPLSLTWSLAAEEQFYVVVPTLEKVAWRWFPVALVGVYVLASLPPFGFFPGLGLPEFFRNTTFGPILLGVMLAHLLDHPRGWALVSRLVGAWIAPLVALVLVGLACSVPVEGIDGWPRLLIHWTLVALVASCVVRERHVLRPVLTLWPMRRIGAVSYGIYLFHPLALYVAYQVVRRAGVSSEAVFVVFAVVGSWTIAEVSYRLYESRFLALKGRVGGGGT